MDCRLRRTPAELSSTNPPPQPRGSQALTWLHLSDLHFREETSYDANIVLKALLRDVDEHNTDEGLRPAFIVVTGDIAFAGQPTEYDMARQFFDDALYFYVRTLDIGGRRIVLLGLNSAWLAHGGAEDRGNLLLGERQTRAALAQAGDADLKIALLHHPFDWLREFDRGDSEALLTDNVDFILHGHMHQVGLLQARGPDSNAFILAAGACYETREHPNAYNFVQLDLGTGQGAVHLRTYSDKRGGFWTKDVMNYRNVPDGVYRFALAGELPPSRAASGGQTAHADRGSAAAPGRGVAQTGSGNIAVTGDIQGGVTIIQDRG